MKNKEIVKEIKGMQAKLETLIGKIEKKEKPAAGKWAEIEQPKLTLGGHEVTVSKNKHIIYFNGGFIYLETARNIVDSNIESFITSCKNKDIEIQVDELQELITKIDAV